MPKVAGGVRHKTARKKPKTLMEDALTFPKTFNEAINDFFADVAGVFLTATFIGYIVDWSGSYLFMPFIVLTANVTDGTHDGIEFLYAKGIPGDLQFIFWYSLLACVISDLLRDAFYTRWTKSVVTDLHPTVQVQLHHLVFNGGMLAFGKTVYETNAGFSFPLGPTDLNLTVFLLFEVVYWTAAPVSSYFLFKLRGDDHWAWTRRSMAYACGIFGLYFLGCRKLAFYALLCDHFRAVPETMATLLALTAKKKDDDAHKKLPLGPNAQQLADVNIMLQPMIRLFVLMIGVAIPGLAIKAGPATATEMLHWSVTLGVLAASQIFGIVF